MNKYYVLFPNHFNGIKLHEALKRTGIKNTIAPTPRELSSCCGVSLLIQEEDVAEVERIISHDKIEILRIASIQKN